MRRIYDMWRVGMKIHTKSNKTRDEDGDDDEMQSFIRSLLSHHMDTDVHSKDAVYCIDDVKVPLISKPSSGSEIKFTSPYEQKDLTLDVKSLHRDVLMILEDSRISIILEGIKRSFHVNVGVEVEEQSDRGVNIDKKDELRLIALYVCRVLHGLGSVLLPSGEWRDTCAQWGRYTQVQFEHLHEFIMEVLHVENIDLGRQKH